MSEKTEVVEQVDQAQLDQQAESDLESGFNGSARAESAPAATPEPVASPEAKPEGAEQDPPLVAGIPEEQVRSLLSKMAEFDSFREEFSKTKDTLFGKFGEINRTVQSLQKAPTAAAGAKFTKEAFKHVSGFSDEMAEALAEDLSSVIPAGVKPDELEAMLAERLEKTRHEITMEMERKALLRQHRDFYDQTATPEFKLWFNQMKPEDQATFSESGDADYLAEQMTAFKKWRESLSKKQQQKSRLEEAVHPQGTVVSSGALTDEQAFEQGFYGKR